MYTQYYSTYKPFTWEPPLEPPCEEPDPEMDCPECAEEMEWQQRNSQFYCSQCDECHELPEPDFDYDEYEERRYGYGY